MADTLLLAVAERVATVTLNRPERRNAMSAQFLREMMDCAHQLAARDDVDAVVVTGAGGVFSAGADLKDPTRWQNDDQSLIERRETASLGLRMARAWEELPQPTIGAVEGYAIGGGQALLAALDRRVIASNAYVSLPEIALGIPLTWGTIPRLVNLVGLSRAKRLTMLCEKVGADEALSMGLVDYVTAPGGALAKATEIARAAVALPRHSVRMSKETANLYASIGAHAVSYAGHDQLMLSAASPESAAARAAKLKK